MTRAEAIELAAKAIFGRRNRDPLGWETEKENTRRLWRADATVALDALLEAGMSFGEDLEQVGWSWTDGTGWFLHHGAEAIAATDRPVFIHRPQGESK